MAKDRFLYRYRRQRADGKANETTSAESFGKWLKEAEPGDEFFVGRFLWVQCEQDGTRPFGTGEVPRVTKVCEVDAKDNSRKKG
jgi:hypothetical protein